MGSLNFMQKGVYWVYTMGNISTTVFAICKMPRLSEGAGCQLIDLSTQVDWNQGDLAREFRISQSRVSELIMKHRETDAIKDRPRSACLP